MIKLMKKLVERILTILGTAMMFAVVASSQTVEPTCPADKVCISREAAQKAVADDAEVKALRVQVAELKQGVADHKDLLNRSRIEFAACSGELTALKQNAVQDRAIIDILLKNVRPKKIGLINF